MKHAVRAVIIMAVLLFAFFKGTVAVHAEERESYSTAQLAIHTIGPDDIRAFTLKAYLIHHNSPLAENADAFIREADRNGLDWKLVAAIAGTESTFGKHIPKNSYNAWGWGVFTGTQDGVHFDGWSDGIARVSEGLRKNYIDQGAETLYDIGWIYAANGNSWGNHVSFFMNEIENFVPDHPETLSVTI
jgi:hypothetical protein